ncbi:MAG: adenylate/guanylate cyclase domain-containing protein [Betaproteobacteria bacterium]|nr:adenylate/guanylate cyclase domain-containing protein [Betaproteobacteria bacterium]
MKQRLAAILAADVAGYSRLMAADERATVAALDAARGIFRRMVESNQGRVIDMAGDSVLAVFETATGAVNAAIAVQKELGSAAEKVPENRQMRFRIGVHLGDVMEKADGTVYGDGVNIAARLESLAEPGGTVVSEAVQTAQRDRLPTVFEDMGEHTVKNIAHPVRAYRVRIEGTVGGAGAAPEGHGAPLVLPDKPSIAVLPFNNMSGDPEQEFFADGVVEAITATLSRIRSFFVIARNSAFRYKGRAVNVPEVGRELGVRYLLEGSVQKAGNRLRITVQLIDAVANAHIWADRVDGTLEDLFELQDRITEQVAGALQPSIRLAEIERARRKRPQDLGAYDYTMRAMPLVWALEMEASENALKLLGQALAIDPEYPLALSLAGWCHAQRMVYNWTDDIDAARSAALSHAEKAAELSGDDPLILAVLGAVHTFLRNYGTARIMLERAVALDPNAAWAWSRLGWVENYSDHPERATEYFQRALRLSPLDPMNFNNYVGMGSANEVAERYEEAVALYRRALQERPHALWILRNLVCSLVGADRVEEAKVEFAHLCSAYPGLTVAKFKKAMVFSPAVLDRMAAQLKTMGLPD